MLDNQIKKCNKNKKTRENRRKQEKSKDFVLQKLLQICCRMLQKLALLQVCKSEFIRSCLRSLVKVPATIRVSATNLQQKVQHISSANCTMSGD